MNPPTKPQTSTNTISNTTYPGKGATMDGGIVPGSFQYNMARQPVPVLSTYGSTRKCILGLAKRPYSSYEILPPIPHPVVRPNDYFLLILPYDYNNKVRDCGVVGSYFTLKTGYFYLIFFFFFLKGDGGTKK